MKPQRLNIARNAHPGSSIGSGIKRIPAAALEISGMLFDSPDVPIEKESNPGRHYLPGGSVRYALDRRLNN